MRNIGARWSQDDDAASSPGSFLGLDAPTDIAPVPPVDRRVARRRIVLSTAIALGFLALLVVVIVRRREEFSEAVGRASWWALAVAIALQVIALLARTEAWHVCIEAAGGTVPRRALFRASGIGSLGSQLNSQVGTAARIAALRRIEPDAAPRVPALIAAEVPIIVVEGAFGAVASFTLIGPLGLPWWSPALALVLVGGISFGLGRMSRGHETGWRTGLAVLAHLNGRNRTIAFVMVAVACQITRNWVMLHAIGVEASFFDATAVLIAMAVISQLPLGPSTGAAAVVLILGSGGFVAATAAGVLLTATGTVGAVLFVLWAAGDAAWVSRRKVRAAAQSAMRTDPAG
jgi:uncharacterized membrane protein YbhN (UPF0104 family)